MYTIECAKSWAAENVVEIMAAYEVSSDIPVFLKGPRLEEVWKAGCFLRDKLLEHGATEDQTGEIGFAMGQRSLCDDPWKCAIKYLNEFVLTKDVKEKPGSELAAKIIAGRLTTKTKNRLTYLSWEQK